MPEWSARTLMRYSLLQLPGLAVVVLVLILIQHWVTLPPWLFWGIIVVWITIDAALFPLLWRSYDPRPSGPTEAMIGAVGMTRERLEPTGYIVVRGVLWRAQVAGGGPPIESNQPVRVETRRGLTLIVVPAGDTSSRGYTAGGGSRGVDRQTFLLLYSVASLYHAAMSLTHNDTRPSPSSTISAWRPLERVMRCCSVASHSI
jgi:membrane protein implicated in regulation of membrane protease activity